MLSGTLCMNVITYCLFTCDGPVGYFQDVAVMNRLLWTLYESHYMNICFPFQKIPGVRMARSHGRCTVVFFSLLEKYCWETKRQAIDWKISARYIDNTHMLRIYKEPWKLSSKAGALNRQNLHTHTHTYMLFQIIPFITIKALYKSVLRG